MVYMAANNDLSGAAAQNLADIRSVGASAGANVMVFIKQAPAGNDTPTASRIRIGAAGSPDTTINLGNVDSGDPQTVLDFVEWAVSTAPADKYALILWSHGGGWSPNDMAELYKQVSSGQDLTKGEATYLTNHGLASSVFTSTVRKILSEPSSRKRYILVDDGSQHSLDTIELGNVIAAAATMIGHHLDLLGMDACLMNEIEVIYQVAANVATVVASEELEPDAGWRYAQILQYLAAHPAASSTDLATTITNAYVEYYKTQRSTWPVTQCAVQAEGVRSFADKVDALADALKAGVQDTWPAIQKAQLKAERFDSHLIDLKSVCNNILTAGITTAASAAATDILGALDPGHDLILAEGHLGPEVANCGGVSIYFPTPGDGISKYYGDTAFGRAQKWGGFLEAYVSAASS